MADDVDPGMIDNLYREYLAALETDDVKRRPERAKRLAMFDRIFQASPVGFFGGRDSFGVYRELRSAFVEGLYLTTTMLAVSCVEKELGAKLHARGITDGGDISHGRLVEIAFALSEIDSALRECIMDLTSVRDAYASFRPPIQDAQTVSFHLHHRLGIHELAEHDASDALQVLVELLARPTMPPEP
jgi:hypothetical protein